MPGEPALVPSDQVAVNSSAPPVEDFSRRGLAFVQRIGRLLYPTLTVVCLLVLWEVAVIVARIPAYLLPRPSSVLAVTLRLGPYLLTQSVPTFEEIAAGFFLSIAFGVPLGVLLVSSPILERTLYPVLVASQTVPKVALAPLMVVWFGFGLAPKIFIAFLIAFFPIVISTAVGLRSVPTEMIDLATSMSASPWSMFWKVRLPHALPSIFGGLKVAITLAVIGAIVGEFVGADRGLGYVLQVANGKLDTNLLFAAILVLVLIGIVTFLLVEFAERLSIPWHVSIRKEDNFSGSR